MIERKGLDIGLPVTRYYLRRPHTPESSSPPSKEVKYSYHVEGPLWIGTSKESLPDKLLFIPMGSEAAVVTASDPKSCNQEPFKLEDELNIDQTTYWGEEFKLIPMTYLGKPTMRVSYSSTNTIPVISTAAEVSMTAIRVPQTPIWIPYSAFHPQVEATLHSYYQKLQLPELGR